MGMRCWFKIGIIWVKYGNFFNYHLLNTKIMSNIDKNQNDNYNYNRNSNQNLNLRKNINSKTIPFAKRNKSTMLLTAAPLIASILLLSFISISSIQGQLVMAQPTTSSAQSSPSDISNKLTNNQQSTSGVSSLPQPNGSPLVTAKATNSLFEPAAGLSNVFGPKGLFPMTKVFNCANALTCGVSGGGSDAQFTGTFDQGNKNGLTGYQATYTSPVTYGPQQMAGHTYKITLTDLQWNSTDVTKQTRQADFAKQVNNVGLNQIQHGASYVDRSDVPQLFDTAFLYGHAKVTDITNGNNTVVAQDIFTHVMIAHVMDQVRYYKDLTDVANSPTMVFLFAVNIPPGADLPGVGKLTPDKAISFTPLSSDPSLKNTPQVNYPVKMALPAKGIITAPQSQSTAWPVDNPKQPLFFTFLVYQNTDVKLSSAK